MKIETVFSNNDYMVIDKPSGISVHNDPKGGLDLLQILKKQTGKEIFFPHRLDQDTSGLILACHQASLVPVLQKILEQGQKTYTSVLRGAKVQDQKWDWPISDKAEGRRNPAGNASDQKQASTLVKVIQQNAYLSLVECQIQTGRQHQIRKHAALNGSAVVGDKRYGEDKFNKMIVQRYGFDRLALHAGRLRLQWQGTELVYESPTPQEFLKLFEPKVPNQN